MHTYRNNTINGMLKNLTLFVNSFNADNVGNFFMNIFDVDNNKTAKIINKTMIVLGVISFFGAILTKLF